jgi:hypothetical protein
MPITDNGDIVRAVGFVAIYGAYLEDRIAELVELSEKHINLRKNIHKLSASDQARHLLTSLKIKFDKAPQYHSKDSDIEKVTITLNAVEPVLKERHHVIHSTLISNSRDGAVTQKNRRSNTEDQIESKEIIDLANEIFELQSQVSSLDFPIKRLISA